MIIVEENDSEAYTLLNAIRCPENKDCEDCKGLKKKGYKNCWDCFSKTYGITFKFAPIKREMYSR
jgi:hypothetical protein